MSPICQIFVQNSWRKDLCSNCFKSKEEHEDSLKNRLCQPASYAKQHISSDSSSSSKRYVGVAGGRSSLYSRGYYGSTSPWNSILFDNKETNNLKSPGLISRLDNLIKQENERNNLLTNLTNEKETLPRATEDDIRQHEGTENDGRATYETSCPIKEKSWIISDLIGETKDIGDMKCSKDKDTSSDLGSDASHDTSVASSDQSSDIACSSGRSSSELKEECYEEDECHSDIDDKVATERIITGILKSAAKERSLSKERGITFKEDDDVIGYGGDVDYSDDDDDYDDCDDSGEDDDISVSSLDMTLEERELKYLTEHNTTFNSENENLSSPPESKTETKDSKQEGKIKLKRSAPLVTTKPNMLKTNSAHVQALPATRDAEDVPMRGIKPKYVARDDEMVEKKFDDHFMVNERVNSFDDHGSKVTSIDEVVSRVSSINNSVPQINKSTPKVTSIDDILRVASTGCEIFEDSITPKDSLAVEKSMKDKSTNRMTTKENRDTATNSENNLDRSKETFVSSNQALHFQKKLFAIDTESPTLDTHKHTSDLEPPEHDKELKKQTASITNTIQKEEPVNCKFENKEPIDYTVKSAQCPLDFKNSTSTQWRESKGSMNKLRCSAVPLNVITIQRRSSFMESQLGEAVGNNEEETLANCSKEVKTQNNADVKLNLKDNGPNIKADSNCEQNKNLTSESKEPSTQKTGITSNFTGKIPQSSFLHTNGVKAIKNSILNNALGYSSPQFLVGMKPDSSEVSPKCNYQNAPIYASLSCLKGLPPAAKPITMPKPNFLRERPKLPLKQNLSSSAPPLSKEKIYASVSIPNLSTSSSDIQAKRQSNNIETDPNPLQKIENNLKPIENIYDVPVTVSKTNSVTTSPTSSTSGYSTSSQTSLVSGLHDTVINKDTESERVQSNVDPVPEPSSHYRSTFEANRNLLSTALCLGTSTTFPSSPISSISNKRPAPQPPHEENAFSEKKSPTVEVTTVDAPPVTAPEETVYNDKISEQPYQRFDNIPSYVNLSPAYENLDVDSYSSFTDDFDDDDDDEPDSHQGDSLYTLKRAERSSSATPYCRTSDFQPINSESMEQPDPSSLFLGKPPAVRSHSVPRSVENAVHPILPKLKGEASKFTFGFFRPSSPPSMKRKISSERGRDRSKKALTSTGFSLRKLLRLGGSSQEKASKAAKMLKDMKENDCDRETRKQKLKIIHPLDYNPNGVEVISRPEKTSPIYDYTGILLPSSGAIQSAQEYSSEVAFNSKTSGAATLPKSFIKKDSKNKGKVEKKNSFLRKKLKPERRDSAASHRLAPDNPQILQKQATISNNSFPSSTSVPSTAPSSEGVVIPPASRLSSCSSVVAISTAKAVNHQNGDASKRHSSIGSSNTVLGFNSEGRPKPPPPPRKTSLEATSSYDETGSTSTSSQCSDNGRDDDHTLDHPPCHPFPPPHRVHRPPPPRRTPSNANESSSILRHQKTTSLYANLGDVRAPFTPRKPGRTSSVKDEEKEKRRAPDPPTLAQRVENSGHKKESFPVSSHEVATVERQSDSRLEDQYGALVRANLDALSNLLDQISSHRKSGNYKPVTEKVSSLSDVEISSNPVSCGSRHFYPGRAINHDVTVMMTSEIKVVSDPLLMPVPLVSLKEDIPSKYLFRNNHQRNSTNSGTVWILPRLDPETLIEFSGASQRLLEQHPTQWEKHTCLFLLQLVAALKQLQAKGIEESSLDLVLVSEGSHPNAYPRLVLVTPPQVEASDSISLCHCAASVVQLLLGHSNPVEGGRRGPILSPPFTPTPHAFSALVTILREERATSLTKAKCILEAMLFGPDPRQWKMGSTDNIEGSLQKWLDLERANALQSLIKEKPSDDECLWTKFYLYFLVRTTVKSLREALVSLQAPDVTNF